MVKIKNIKYKKIHNYTYIYILLPQNVYCILWVGAIKFSDCKKNVFTYFTIGMFVFF